ncbi:MAG: PDZ domain-containing protein [Desulfobacterales bacterium]|nr:MAG: PDZ domain-containing protein [Desulfobacterales bacterium]
MRYEKRFARFKKIILYLLLFQLPVAAGSTAAQSMDPPLISEGPQGKLRLQARGSPLEKILDAIRRNFRLEIDGLEHRAQESITYFCEAGSLEEALKRLLRHLHENNYAFEFREERLSRVAVLPEAKIGPAAPAYQEETKEPVFPPSLVNVVQVIDVVEGTQAQDRGLLKGDLIVEYDGAKIGGILELVKATKEKSPSESVAVGVLRDQEPLQFVLNGGFMGVRIQSISIPKEEMDNYF